MNKCIVWNGILYFIKNGRIWEVIASLAGDIEVYRMNEATPCDSPSPEIARLLRGE